MDTKITMSENVNENEELTVKQAGAKGGRTTLERHGREFYREIGKKGGKQTATLYKDLLSEFGRRGGRPRRPSLDEYMGEEAGNKRR